MLAYRGLRKGVPELRVTKSTARTAQPSPKRGRLNALIECVEPTCRWVYMWRDSASLIVKLLHSKKVTRRNDT